jgi:hypothetical protein
MEVMVEENFLPHGSWEAKRERISWDLNILFKGLFPMS